jgi:hypothetical protein
VLFALGVFVGFWGRFPRETNMAWGPYMEEKIKVNPYGVFPVILSPVPSPSYPLGSMLMESEGLQQKRRCWIAIPILNLGVEGDGQSTNNF